MHFYYQRNFAGQWAPCKSPSPPITKSANGGKRAITPPVKLEGEQVDMTLDQLAGLYPPPQTVTTPTTQEEILQEGMTE